jgi:hypothetical protein
VPGGRDGGPAAATLKQEGRLPVQPICDRRYLVREQMVERAGLDIVDADYSADHMVARNVCRKR